MKHQTLTFSFHNTEFFGQYWQPQIAKGVVLILHGLGEHSGRFTHIAEALTKNNFGVIAFDHFGHGKTSGKRGHNPGYEIVLDSIEQFIDKTETIFGGLPIFLYGHSMGGNAIINYILSRKHTLKGAIATSPFLKLAFEPPKWKITLGKVFQKIAPSITLGNEIDASFISRDKDELEKYKTDPLVHAKVSPNFSLSFMEKGVWAIENASKLEIPMFLAHGTDDKLISYKGSEEFAANSDKVLLKLYKNGYHELQNDICKDELINDILSWLSYQV